MKQIILFDGVCNFCQKSVQFIIARDHKAIFQFASLHSPVGKKFLQQHDVPTNENSLILLANNRYYSKSSAALKIAQQLKFPWNLLYVFIIIPKSLRDVLYKFIANNRFKWFGRNDTCMIPSPSDKKRFLD